METPFLKIALAAKKTLSGFVMAACFVLFPIFVILEFDLAWRGKVTFAHILETWQEPSRSGSPVQIARVEFSVDGKPYRVRVSGGVSQLAEPVAVAYSPLWPRFAIAAATPPPRPTTFSLLIRALVCLLFGLIARSIYLSKPEDAKETHLVL
jgi:hypothetical protein